MAVAMIDDTDFNVCWRYETEGEYPDKGFSSACLSAHYFVTTFCV